MKCAAVLLIELLVLKVLKYATFLIPWSPTQWKEMEIIVK